VTFIYRDLDFPFSFSGILKKDALKGQVKIETGGALPDLERLDIPFQLTRISDSPPIPPYLIKHLTIPSHGIKLDAHLYLPEKQTLCPGLILLPGSLSREKGDMAFYADFFARQGVASLVFDKRGSGKSNGAYHSAAYSDFADDAAACLDELSRQARVDKRRIGLMGISQGALLLPIIASKSPIPAFLIAVSPEVTCVLQSSIYQDGLRLRRLGYSDREVRILEDSHNEVARMIRRGKSAREVERFILDNAAKHSFMNQTSLHDRVHITPEAFSGFYWKDRVTDLYSFWNRLSVDTLVILGEKDMFIDAAENRRQLERLNRPNIQIRIFAKANHVMKKAVDPLTSSPDAMEWPRVLPEYLELLKEWAGRK
jgi:Predicted acyl esterases